MGRPDPNGCKLCGLSTCDKLARRAAYEANPVGAIGHREAWQAYAVARDACESRPAVDWQDELRSLLAGDGLGLAEEAERRWQFAGAGACPDGEPGCVARYPTAPRDWCLRCISSHLAAALRMATARAGEPTLKLLTHVDEDEDGHAIIHLPPGTPIGKSCLVHVYGLDKPDEFDMPPELIEEQRKDRRAQSTAGAGVVEAARNLAIDHRRDEFICGCDVCRAVRALPEGA